MKVSNLDLSTPIKFKSSNGTSHEPQVKTKVVQAKHTKKPKAHASQDNFYADYVLTWNHKGKVVAKYVGPRTQGSMIKRNVWMPKVLVTNVKGPNSNWVPKNQA